MCSVGRDSLLFLELVLALEGQLGLLCLSQAGVGFCGSQGREWWPAQGAAISTHSQCAQQELNSDSQQVLHHQARF